MEVLGRNLDGRDDNKGAVFETDSVEGRAVDDFEQYGRPLSLFEHPLFNKYVHMDKMIVGPKGARELELIADQLVSEEEYYRLLQIAGSAYIESMLARSDELPIDEKLSLLENAEHAFIRSIQNQQTLDEIYEKPDDYTDQYRDALNIACMPLLRAFAKGNIDEKSIQESLIGLVSIAESSVVQLNLALKDDNERGAAMHRGLQHEINAILAFMHQKDPRYLVLPSPARSGMGYYHREQTHDLIFITQHYGSIRSVVPLEIKASPSRHDRGRYKALIVRGKMHLAAQGCTMPGDTTRAFGNYIRGDNMSELDDRVILAIQTNIKNLISDYKKGGEYLPLKRKTNTTKYFRTDQAAKVYAA